MLQTLTSLTRKHKLESVVSIIVLDGDGQPSLGQGSPAALATVLNSGIAPAVAIHSRKVNEGMRACVVRTCSLLSWRSARATRALSCPVLFCETRRLTGCSWRDTGATLTHLE